MIIAAIPIPNIDAELQVSDLRSAIFWGQRRWVLVMTMRGPDARYNAARGVFSPTQVRGLTRAFAQALDLMAKLPVGDQESQHVDVVAPGIIVERSRGRASLRFQLSSGTRIFARYLSPDDVRKAVEILDTLPHRARQIAGEP